MSAKVEGHMKAATYTQPGSPDVLTIAEFDKPVPTGDEVLIKVRAASLNPADWRVAMAGPAFRSLMFKIGKAKVRRPGIDVAGEVEAIGGHVTRFKPGDTVFGAAHGAFAEYACGSESKFALKPDNLTFEQAASVPVAGLTALQGLRDHGHLQPGQKVLINGAAGGVGTFAVQIAKAMGAQVTGVCSTNNAEMVRSLGADRVIDYTRDDFTNDPERYDLLLDNVANRSLSKCRRVLKPGGMLVIAGAPKNMGAVLLFLLKVHVVHWFTKRTLMFMARINSADLTALAELIAAGKVKPVIDRRYSLAEISQAMRYCATGHARAKVVINLG